MKIYQNAELKGAPKGFKSAKAVGKQFSGMQCTVQISTEDCTGCTLCFQVCPARKKGKDGKPTEEKALKMIGNNEQVRSRESKNWQFFLDLPEMDNSLINTGTIKGSQLLRSLFEFSGACAGCGETPYVKLATQLFGDRMLIANATGCSSIYGGNLPTTPYARGLTAAVRPGPTPFSRTTPSTAWGCGSRSTS
jgi:pyruvate-ferredoxin/flavodoxin oxidoreductase